MKALIRTTAALAALSSLALTGCAEGTNSLATGSLNASKVAAKPKVDPACVVLTAKIDSLRNEGTMARLEKVAAGKTRSVMIKRAAIAKATKLNRANAEFQLKCTSFKPSTAAAKPKPATKAKKAAKVASAVKAKLAKPAVKAATVTVKKAAKKVIAATAVKAATSSATSAAATAATNAVKAAQ